MVPVNNGRNDEAVESAVLKFGVLANSKNKSQN